MKPKINISTRSVDETMELKFRKKELKYRVLSHTGSIRDAETELLIMALKSLALESEEPIYLYLYNTNCSLANGFALFDTIRMLPCEVYTIGCGILDSVSSLLVAAGSKGKRYLSPSSECMLGYPDDNPTLLMSTYHFCREHHDRHMEKLVTLLSLCTVKSPGEVQFHMEHNQSLSASTALIYGIADNLGDPLFKPIAAPDTELEALSHTRNIGVLSHAGRMSRDRIAHAPKFKTDICETAMDLLDPKGNIHFEKPVE